MASRVIVVWTTGGGGGRSDIRASQVEEQVEERWKRGAQLRRPLAPALGWGVRMGARMVSHLG